MAPSLFKTTEEANKDFYPNFWCDLFGCKMKEHKTSENTGYFKCSRCNYEDGGYISFKFTIN